MWWNRGVQHCLWWQNSGIEGQFILACAFLNIDRDILQRRSDLIPRITPATLQPTTRGPPETTSEGRQRQSSQTYPNFDRKLNARP